MKKMKACTTYNDRCTMDLIVFDENIQIIKTFKEADPSKYFEVKDVEDVKEFLDSYIEDIMEEKYYIRKDIQLLLHKIDGPAAIEYREDEAGNKTIKNTFYYMGKKIEDILALNVNRFYYIEKDSYNKKDTFKANGCKWDNNLKMWYTEKEEVANKFNFIKIEVDFDAYIVAAKLIK